MNMDGTAGDVWGLSSPLMKELRADDISLNCLRVGRSQ